MTFAIYQINSKKDKERVRFENYERTLEWAGKVNAEIYDCVFDGIVNGDVDDPNEFIEWLYMSTNFRTGAFEDFKGRSMSVSDVVVVGSEVYFIDSVGIQKIPGEGFLE